MTHRERREARAARLDDWAEKRQQKAEALEAATEPFRGDIAFITQPGHDMQRLRNKVNAKQERAWEHQKKAKDMSSRAEGIRGQLERSIYSDDEDAIERLQERIADLEAERARLKADRRPVKPGYEAKPRTSNLGGADMHYASCGCCGWIAGGNQIRTIEDAQKRADRHNKRCPGVDHASRIVNLTGSINRQKKRLEELRGQDA